MAYTQPLVVSCDMPRCDKRAVLEVFHWRNHSVGKFCRSHAARRISELKRAEGEVTVTEARL